MERISQLIQLFEASSLTELSYQGNGFNVTLKKGIEPTSTATTKAVMLEVGKVNLTSTNKFISSEGVGTFYTSPSPNEPPFIKVGDKLEEGQVIGILEAMKVMTEIKSTISGKVERILVENGTMIEYGTKLVEVSDV